MVFFLFLITLLIGFVWSKVYGPQQFKRIELLHFDLFRRKISNEQKIYLHNNYRFYRNLKPHYQEVFEHRVAKFTKHYKFVARHQSEPTEEMKTLIAGCYVQLTFGMQEYLSQKFSKILIYPEAFPSRFSDNFHIGEFNKHLGVIVFAWDHFLQGIQIDNSNLNLGIHEFTHALLSESIDQLANYEGDVETQFYNSFQVFGLVYKEIIKHVSTEHNSEYIFSLGYFREYAYTNNHEFISVILEYFFETPEIFKEKLPILYAKVAKMISYKEHYFR